MSELFVKICGITNVEDAQVALDAGASAIGVVLSEAARKIDIGEAIKIRELAGEKLVGVFRAIEDPNEVIKLAQEIGLTTVQLHHTSPAAVAAISEKLNVIVAYSFDDPEIQKATSGDNVFIVDSAEPGSGQLFDHSTLQQNEAKMVIAGGLNPENVADAVRAVRPFGVDVSSGVCGADPRQKDADKVASFIHSARAALDLD